MNGALVIPWIRKFSYQAVVTSYGNIFFEIRQFEYCVGHFGGGGGQILFQFVLIVLQKIALVTKYNSTDPISRLTLDKEWPIYSKLALSTLMLTLT